VQRLRFAGITLVVGIAVTACSSSGALTGAVPAPNSVLSRVSANPGWISRNAENAKELLYVSDTGQGMVDIFSVPSYSMVGQITKGIDLPEGVATDNNGYLYVANFQGGTVTVYKPGQTSPSRTLPDAHEPEAVAVAANGYVYVGDLGGGIDVFPPGAKSPSQRIAKPALDYGVLGLAVDSLNNIYGAGDGVYGPVVVEFYHASQGGGTNLKLTGLDVPAGVLIDSERNIVVSDVARSKILVYAPGRKKAYPTFAVPTPEGSALYRSEGLVYAPEAANNGVGVYKYPSGSLVTTIAIGHFTAGAAVGPAPNP
jgi:hypothetical protein